MTKKEKSKIQTWYIVYLFFFLFFFFFSSSSSSSSSSYYYYYYYYYYYSMLLLLLLYIHVVTEVSMFMLTTMRRRTLKRNLRGLQMSTKCFWRHFANSLHLLSQRVIDSYYYWELLIDTISCFLSDKLYVSIFFTWNIY